MAFDWENFKQSNVARIFVAYAVIVFASMQIFDYLLPIIEAPLWVAQTLTIILFLGFPISLLVGWATQIPGERKDANQSPDSSPSQRIPKSRLLIIGLFSSALFGFLGIVLMPFILDQSQDVANQEALPEPFAGANGSPKLDLFLGETSSHPRRGFRTEVSISPAGNLVTFLVNNSTSVDIFLRDLESRESPKLIASASRGGGVGRLQFSPDGEWVHYLDDGELRRVSISGGLSQKVHSSVSAMSGFALKGSDQLLFTDASGRLVNGSMTSSSVQIIDFEDSHLEWPSFLPHGKHALVTRVFEGDTSRSSNIELLNLEQLSTSVVVENGFNAKYVPTGHIVFARSSSLWAVPFDLSTLTIVGDQVPVILELETNGTEGTAVYSFSDSGRLIYLEGADVSGNIAGSRLSRIDRSGLIKDLTIPNSDFGQLNSSSSGDKLALTIYDGNESDIWVVDTELEALERRTFDGKSMRPVWSSEGNTLYYYSRGQGLNAVAADGTGRPITVFPTNLEVFPTSVSPDGDVVFSMGSPLELYSFSLNDGVDAEYAANLLEVSPVIHSWHGAQISPDGNWLAYASAETGERHVFVRPFPELGAGKWQASSEPGFMPLWSKNNSELFYWGEDHNQFAVDYELIDAGRGQSAIKFSSPDEVFSITGLRGNKNIKTWDVGANNEFFMLLFPEDKNLTPEQILENQTILTVVENWFNELHSLSPRKPED